MKEVLVTEDDSLKIVQSAIGLFAPVSFCHSMQYETVSVFVNPKAWQEFIDAVAPFVEQLKENKQ